MKYLTIKINRWSALIVAILLILLMAWSADLELRQSGLASAPIRVQDTLTSGSETDDLQVLQVGTSDSRRALIKQGDDVQGVPRGSLESRWLVRIRVKGTQRSEWVAINATCGVCDRLLYAEELFADGSLLEADVDSTVCCHESDGVVAVLVRRASRDPIAATTRVDGAEWNGEFQARVSIIAVRFDADPLAVHGRVLDSTQGPVRATVGLFKLRDDEGPGDLVASTASDDNGRFYFGVTERDLPLKIVVDDHRSAIACRSVLSMAGADLRDVTLDVGEEIKGLVTNSGGLSLRIVATPTAPVESFSLGNDLLGWAPNYLGRMMSVARTDADGLFRFSGMDRSRYILRLQGPARGCGFSQMAGEGSCVEMSAPSENVVIDQTGTYLILSIEGPDSAPIPNAEVKISTIGSEGVGLICFSDDDGQVQVRLKPNQGLQVLVRAVGWEPLVLLVPGISTGFVDHRSVTLQELEDSSSLYVECTEFVTAGVGVYDESGAPILVDRVRLGPGRRYQAELPPGEYSVLVVPGGSVSYSDQSYYVPCKSRLTLELGEVETVVVPLVVGGRVEVSVVGPSGGPEPANVAVFDESGRDQGIEFVCRAEEGVNLIGSNPYVCQRSGREFVPSQPALPAGRYVLRARGRDSGDSETTFEVVPGQAIQVSVSLAASADHN